MSNGDRFYVDSEYLRADNWPDTIPEMGPVREFGPFPWGEKDHHDPQDVDDYPCYHPNAASCGPVYHGDVCPWCGVPLKHNVEVIGQDGRRGETLDLAPNDVSVPLYHPDCYDERRTTIRRMENRTLGEWTEEQEDDGP